MEQQIWVGCVTTDSNFHMQYADAAFFRYFGDDGVYSILRTVHPEDSGRLSETAAQLRAGQIEQTALRMRGISGDYRWMLVSLSARGAGEHRQYSLRVSDAGRVQRELLELSEENADYRCYLNLMRDLAFRYSPQTQRIQILAFDCCQEVILSDMLLAEWKQEALAKNMVETHDIPAFEKLCADIAGGTVQFRCELETSVCSLGRRMEYCAFRGVNRADAPGRGTVLGTISFLHAKYKSKEPGWLLETTRDSATDLPGKYAITQHAKSVLAAQPAGTVALVLAAIDGFKEINERYGHLSGDEVLFTFSHILKTEIGTRGTAGRIGGGMFMLVLQDIAGETDLRSILRAIRTKLEWAWDDTGNGRKKLCTVTCSMGAACYPADAKTYEELFRQADKALYIACEKGHNRYVIYDVQKHGEVQTNRPRSYADLYAAAPAQSNAGFTAGLVHGLLCGESRPDVPGILAQIGSQFGLDGIHIFLAPEWRAGYSWGHPVCGTGELLVQEPFVQSFHADHTSVIDNINALEGIADGVFAWLERENLLGTVLYLAERDGKPLAVISFGLFGHFRKWSNLDIGQFTILGGLLSALL